MTTPASRPAADPPTTHRTWTVVIDMPVHGGRGKNAWKPVGWQSLNNLPDTRIEKMRWSKAKKQWRVAAFAAIVRAGVPQHLGRIEVGIELRFTENRADRNAENYEQTIKPCIDALGKQRIYTYVDQRTGKPKQVIEVGREVVPGDDPRYLVRTGAVTIGPPLGRKSKVRGQVVLTIRQFPPAVDGGTP